jgi:hypothetical protein
MVFVSTAEIDSVQRRIELGVLDPALEPAAKGVLSIAARPQRWASQMADRSPGAARLLGRSELLRGHLDVNQAGVLAELELSFEFAEDARRAADAASLLGRALRTEPGLTGEIAGALHIEAVDTALVVRLELEGDALGRVVACARDSTACS